MFLDGLEIPGNAEKPATFHRNGGNFGPEWVATFKRNGGSFAPDYAMKYITHIWAPSVKSTNESGPVFFQEFPCSHENTGTWNDVAFVRR